MKISIITPTFNRLSFLKECVRSVQLSVWHPLELDYEHIICDVGSTDGASEWLREEAARDERLVLVRHEAQLPPAAARNLAIKQATGEYLLPLDDDDLILQRTLYNFASAAQVHQAPWLVSDFLRVDAEGRYRPGDDYYSWHFPSADEMLAAIFGGGHYIQGNVLYQRQLFDRVGGYDETMTIAAEDIDLYIRFIKEAGRPQVESFISHLHRVHGANISQGISLAKHNSMMQVLAQKYGWVE